jgi:cyclic pyranopterin phosphate synthase
MPSAGSLVDRCDRVHDELRISVTDRCNPRRVYWMPEEDMTCLPRSQPLAYEEITQLARVVRPRRGVDSAQRREPLIPEDLPVFMPHNVVSSPAAPDIFFES